MDVPEVIYHPKTKKGPWYCRARKWNGYNTWCLSNSGERFNPCDKVIISNAFIIKGPPSVISDRSETYWSCKTVKIVSLSHIRKWDTC